jgi:hypothetical protein
MTLREKQDKFAGMVAQLIVKAHQLGFTISFGEAYRSKHEAARLAAAGKGIKNSLHTLRLAIDINLFRDGVYLRKSEDHRPLGEWWESIGGSWGGRFGDGNHYSLAHGKRR